MLPLVMLSSCGPVYRTEFQIVPPKAEQGRMCANQCLMMQQTCHHACSREAAQCNTMAHLQAQNDYLLYVQERQHRGLPIKRTPASFNYGGCSEDGCSERCEGDYHICHTNCGGQVIPRTFCAANCATP